MGEIINIRAFKHPDIPHYEWQGELIRQTNDYVMVLCKPERKLKHFTKDSIYTIDNTSLEFFSLKEWYTVAMEIEKGKIVSYYCNISKPAMFNNNQLSFIDLDLDLVKKREEDWEIVDEDEFEVNSTKYGYSPYIKEMAIKEIEKLKRKALNKEFPFNDELIEMLIPNK